MAGLCTVQDVKARSRITDTRWDTLIEAWIEPASIAVEDHCGGRQFLIDDTSSTRVFTGAGGRFVAIDDLSAKPTLVELHDREGNLNADLTSIVTTSPRNLRAGGWQPIRGLWFRTRTIPRGWEIYVTGVWGFPLVPPHVKEAVIETIRDWLRDAQAVIDDHPDIDGLGNGPISRGIPPRARNLVENLVRDEVAY